MYFLLHHSTGALMLEADNRNAALSWSERQLGHRTTATFVVELEDHPPSDWVEKSGTGIGKPSADSCEAKLSFMADSVQRVAGLDREVFQSHEWYRAAELRSQEATVH
jgi:hypothetical protein